MMPGRIFRIGSRGSRLAMEQAGRVQRMTGSSSEIRVIQTSGDRFTEKPLHEQNGVGFFTKEIEQELLQDGIDMAVHSLKDLPTSLAPGLVLAAVLERDSPSDMLLVHPDSFAAGMSIPLSGGASVGASSLRRQALLGRYRPDLVPVPVRGNVPTRIEKLLRGDLDSIVIARAGLERLKLDTGVLRAFDLNPGMWVCAPGQGVIAVETREDDSETISLLQSIEHEPTRKCVNAERDLHVSFGGGCHAPFGAWADFAGDEYRICLAAPSGDGEYRIRHVKARELKRASEEAEEWIRTGRREVQSPEKEEWICRPARPWC